MPAFFAGSCRRLAFSGQNQMQVGVGENQKPVVKVIIKGNLFLYKFWLRQSSPLKLYMYVYACTYAFGESDWMHFPKRQCTSYFTKCGWEAVFINSNFLFLVMCLHKKHNRNAFSQLRLRFPWLSAPLLLTSGSLNEIPLPSVEKLGEFGTFGVTGRRPCNKKQEPAKGICSLAGSWEYEGLCPELSNLSVW